MKLPNDSRWVYLLAGVPPALLLLFQLRYAITIPYMDQWELVPYLERMYAGELSVASLFDQHNAHRIAIPRTVMLAMAFVTGWDIRFEIAINYILGIAIFATIGWKQKRIDEPLTLITIAVLIFSVAQWRNWLWGWQMQIFMCCLFAAVSLRLLTRADKGMAPLFGAIVLGVGATFSFAAGLAVWPAGVLVLLRKETARQLGVWLLGALATTIAYLATFSLPGDATPPTSTFRAPVEFVEYVFAFIGGVLGGFYAPFALWAGLAGITVLAVEAVTAFRRKQPFSFGLALGVFVVGAACITALGRGGEGIDQAIASRYTTFGALLWVGLILHTQTNTDRVLRSRRFATAILVFACAGSAYGFYAGAQRANHYNAARTALIEDGDWETLQRLYPDEATLRERRSFLEANELSVFKK